MTFETGAQIATSIGVMFALVGLLVSMSATRGERRQARSEFCMREVLRTWQQIHELLKDGNNDRKIWILASRLIAKAEKMRVNVTEQSHRDVLEVAELQYRGLIQDDVFGGSFQSKQRGAHFYGVAGSEQGGTEIDEAAASSTRGGGLAMIDESSLYAVWQWAQFPPNYEDPLSEERFSDEWLETATNKICWPGVHEYVSHTRRFRTIGGQITPRDSDTGENNSLANGQD